MKTSINRTMGLEADIVLLTLDEEASLGFAGSERAKAVWQRDVLNAVIGHDDSQMS